MSRVLMLLLLARIEGFAEWIAASKRRIRVYRTVMFTLARLFFLLEVHLYWQMFSHCFWGDFWPFARCIAEIGVVYLLVAFFIAFADLFDDDHRDPPEEPFEPWEPPYEGIEQEEEELICV